MLINLHIHRKKVSLTHRLDGDVFNNTVIPQAALTSFTFIVFKEGTR